LRPCALFLIGDAYGRVVNHQETDMDTQINLLSDDALEVVVGGLDMNPATNPGHFTPGQKLPPAPAAAPGTEGNGGILGPVFFGGTAMLYLLLPAVF
jgi:hypothetical protein